MDNPTSRMDLAVLRTAGDIARAFGTEVGTIDSLAQGNCWDAYRRIPIAKRRRRGFRIVYEAIDPELKRIQKDLLVEIEVRAGTLPACVQGFVKERSTLTNASLHTGKREVLNCDIEGFFDAIDRKQVSEVFAALGCDESVADKLAGLCTLGDQLVQGACTSPILANLASRHLDVDLLQLAASFGCTYTRYADDLTFSGEDTPPRERIVRILERHGFTLNSRKFRVQRRGGNQFVTGLSVAGSEPRAPKRMKKRLRLELYYANLSTIDDHLIHTGETLEAFRLRIEGYMNYLRPFEASFVAKMDKDFVRALQKRKGSSGAPGVVR